MNTIDTNTPLVLLKMLRETEVMLTNLEAFHQLKKRIMNQCQ
jgi:hypothetical protein